MDAINNKPENIVLYRNTKQLIHWNVSATFWKSNETNYTVIPNSLSTGTNVTERREVIHYYYTVIPNSLSTGTSEHLHGVVVKYDYTVIPNSLSTGTRTANSRGKQNNIIP